MHRLELALVGRRRGFTLVEMLVVLALMLVLAALAVALVPRMNERAKVPRGASQLQMWLLIARQWAKRDNVPTGIRLQAGQLYPYPGAVNAAYFVNDLNYIQQPPPYHAYDLNGGNDSFLEAYTDWNSTGLNYPTGYSTTYAPNMLKALYQPASSATPASLVDLFGGNVTGLIQRNQQALWQVQPGDYLEMPTGGTIFKIADVVQDPSEFAPPYSFPNPFLPPAGNPPGDYQPGDVLVLAQQHGLTAGTKQSDYRIIRGPRVLPGEQGLQMPQGVAIDTTTNATYGNVLPTNPSTFNFDIVFSPSGQVISQGLTVDKIILWVRDVTQDGSVQPGGTGPGPGGLPAGAQSLIVIYTRTGFIAAHDVYTGANTLGTSPVSPGVNVTITVASTAGINPGDFLIIDWGSAAQETEQVAPNGVNGNQITFGQIMFPHGLSGQYPILSDPYSYVRNAKSSGM